MEQEESAEREAGDGTREVFPEIEIEPPDRRLLVVRIEGLTPLLTNRISEWTIASLKKEALKDEKGRVIKPSSEQQFEASIYRDERGRPSFPAAGIRKAIVTAVTGDDPKRQFFFRQYFHVVQELVPVLGSEPTYREDTARNRFARGALCIAIRAEYKRPWQIDVGLEYNAKHFAGKGDPDGVKKMLAAVRLAGFAVGIGCWRPEKNGVFGQFDVTTYDLIRNVQGPLLLGGEA